MIISSFKLSFVTDTSLRGEPRPLPNVIKRKFNLGLKLYFCSIVTSFKAFILGLPITNDGINPLHVRESRLRNLGKFCLWNTKSWALDSGIQLKESGIPLTIGIQNPSSTVLESAIQYLESRIQDCLGIPLHEADVSFCLRC